MYKLHLECIYTLCKTLQQEGSAVGMTVITCPGKNSADSLFQTTTQACCCLDSIAAFYACLASQHNIKHLSHNAAWSAVLQQPGFASCFAETGISA